MTRLVALVGASLLVASVASAQQDGLPPGHPPMGGQPTTAPPMPAGHPGVPGMPPGHPPTPGTTTPGTTSAGPGEAMPAGHPPVPGAIPAPQPGEAMPPGHPPVPGATPPGQGMPPGHPPADGMPPGHPAVPGGGGGMTGEGRLPSVLRPPSLASQEPNEDLPAGTIRVTVVDGEGQPVPDAAVDVGSLAQGDRERHNARTGNDGVATFTGLATGGGQAYRVNVPHGGAKYSSTPFNLPTDRGFDVRITRLPVTHDDRFVFFHVFRVIVEQRGERMHVIHQAELTNAGTETFVFPAAGERVELVEGYTNFQFQRVISDQRIEELADESVYLLRGSLPPGTVQLAWAYDLPVDAEELVIPVELPLRFFGLQVIAEALPELELSVRGMPPPQRLGQDGQPCESSLATPNCAWVTQLRRGPEDEAIERITLRLTGIPGPSPVRWIAVGLAIFFVIGGAALALLRSADPRAGTRARARRRELLLAEMRELERDHAAGEIGPEFRQRRRDAIVRELAALLHQDDVAMPSGPARRSSAHR